jgi:hypothetical protein
MNLNHLFSVMSTEALAEKSQPDIKSHSVILANRTNAQAANDPLPKGELKPVMQQPVQQVAAQIEPLKKDSSTTKLSHQLADKVKQAGGVQSPMENGYLNHKTKEQPTPQIEETPLSLKNEENYSTIGHGQSRTTDEVLANHERPFFYHLLACPYCHIEKAQYCVSGYDMGSVYEALLLNRADAQTRRESLALRVDRACISGRSVFVSLSSDNAPPPPTNAPIARKYGNTIEYEAFINHWTACQVCKPNLNRYCDEGQRLEKEANR